MLADRHVAQLHRADVVGVHLQVAPPDVVECHVPPYEACFPIEVLRLDHEPENREDAARQLSKALSTYMGMQPLVLAIPRGGVRWVALLRMISGQIWMWCWCANWTRHLTRSLPSELLANLAKFSWRIMR